MAEANASITNDSSGWSSTAETTATAALLSTASYLANNITTSVAAIPRQSSTPEATATAALWLTDVALWPADLAPLPADFLVKYITTSVAVKHEVDTSTDAQMAGQFVGIVFAAAGFMLNVAAFTAVYRANMRNRELRLGLLSLACSDLLLALSNVGFLAVEYQYQFAEQLGLIALGSLQSLYCATYAFAWMLMVCSNAQLFTLTLLAVQQFTAIRWPLRTADGMSSRRSAYALTVGWLVSAMLGFAPAVAVAATTEHHPKMNNWAVTGATRFCSQLILYKQPNTATQSGYKYDLGQSELAFILIYLDLAKMCAQLVALAVSYGYVAHTVKQPRPGDGNDGSAAGVGRRHQERKRVLKVTATVTLLCLCSNLPQFIYNTVCHMDRAKCNSLMHYALMAVVSLSTVADPLVYTLRLRAVRQVALSPLSRFRRCLMNSNEAPTAKQTSDDSRTRQTTT